MAGHEKLLQNAFVSGLQENGWVYSGSEGGSGYDRGSAIIPSDLEEWIISTQKDAWDRLAFKAGNEVIALKLMVEEITTFRKRSPEYGGGTYNLLLRGLKVRDIKFNFFQNKPVSLVSPPESWTLYEKMILRVVSELYYSQRKRDSIDLAFFLNGIPLGTAELKAILGGQGVGHAESQYRNDRIPKGEPLLHSSSGALFHIAAADNLASLTTALNGSNTHFIPFNTGIDNTEWLASNPDDYSVSYLWKDVLKKENLSQIIFTTMRNVEVGGQWQTRFPRYHQFDNLRKIVESVTSETGDKNYLSQHAPGSGKSDEIANLAYALSNIQNGNGKHTYSKIIVITNRTVLDNQIKDLLRSKMVDATHFKHINKEKENSFVSKSKLLFDELVNNGSSRIIAVTAQTFSNTLLDAIRELRAAGKTLSGRFAVIVDEAHDGETGRQHQNMYRALLGVSLDDLNAEEASEEETPEQKSAKELSLTPDEDRKLLPSLNFFAYTATPNHDVLRVFGEPLEDGAGLKWYRPFHSYSMQQAREEGYINDVLENYVTHDRFVNIEIEGTEYKGDRIVDFMSGRRQIGQWLQTQPEVKQDIVDIILDKMTGLVIPSVNGEGKAMLTCSSRLDAVIYKRMIDAEIAKLPKEKQFGTLVAFSGSVYDSALDREVTELDRGLNQSLSKNDIAEQFKENTFRLLIVANKYQVGFDQPKLVCMFLDKPLMGINLVQTTARVNRKIKGKEKVYIFDFANNREDVQEAFSEFDHEASLALDQDLSTSTLDNLIRSANAAEIHSCALTATNGDGSSGNDVLEFKKASDAYSGSGTDQKAKTQASINMANIIGKCAAKFHSDLENGTTTRVEELHKYRTILKRFVSIYNLLSITRDGSEAINAIYKSYGAYAVFFNELAKGLNLTRTDGMTQVDVNALRLKEYKIIENGSVRRDEDYVAEEAISSYGDSMSAALHIAKIGPIEVLINEINDYPELVGQKREDVKEFVDVLVDDMTKDAELQILAKSNNEESFANSNDVKKKVNRLLSRATRNINNEIKTIAKEIVKKQDYDTSVITGFAKMLHRSFL